MPSTKPFTQESRPGVTPEGHLQKRSENLALVKEAGGFLAGGDSPESKCPAKDRLGGLRGCLRFIRGLLNQYWKLLGALRPDRDGTFELPDAGPILEIEPLLNESIGRG